jgi:predicted DNA-binding protein (UPF0278 family)
MTSTTSAVSSDTITNRWKNLNKEYVKYTRQMNKGTKITEKHLFQRCGINQNTVRHEEKKVLIEGGEETY